MSQKKNEIIGLYLGRFQPLHLGHLKAVEYCLSHCDKLFIGICGSNNKPDINNPFTAEERNNMIRQSVGDMVHLIKTFPIADKATHEQWVKHFTYILPRYDIIFSGNPETIEICERFGKKIYKLPLHERENLSGTNIRELIRKDQPYQNLLPTGTLNVMAQLDGVNRIKTIGVSILCTKCNGVILPESKFCSNCGKPVQNAKV